MFYNCKCEDRGRYLWQKQNQIRLPNMRVRFAALSWTMPELR